VDEKATLGRVTWAAFQCATFAEMSGNEKEQKRLFELAVKAGREFLKALESGDISREAVNSEVPIGVIMLLAGPSTDFILGRIFEGAMGEAFDDIVKRDSGGISLPTSEWVYDKDIRRTKASSRFTKNNCALVR
jgi:hypothetical protein